MYYTPEGIFGKPVGIEPSLTDPPYCILSISLTPIGNVYFLLYPFTSVLAHLSWSKENLRGNISFFLSPSLLSGQWLQSSVRLLGNSQGHGNFKNVPTSHPLTKLSGNESRQMPLCAIPPLPFGTIWALFSDSLCSQNLLLLRYLFIPILSYLWARWWSL